MRRLAAAVAALALAACRTSAPPRPAPDTEAAEAKPAEVTPPPPASPRPRPDILVARARALRAEGDVAGARERLEAALELAPADEEARIEMADLLVAEARDLERAEGLLRGIPGRSDRRFHLLQARLAEARGDDASAADAYGSALAAEDDPDVRLRRALALERLGRPEAVEELERVRDVRPDDTVARSRLAERYETAGRLADAEAEYRWLAESQPERAAAWERLARFYERSGRAKEAQAAAARARRVSGRPDRALRPLLPSKR